MSNRTELTAWMREHLFYEWQMLNHSLSRAIASQNPSQQLDFNAFFESYGVHARNLYDFLSNDKGAGSNNAVACDYVKDFKFEKTDVTKSITPRLDWQLAHAGKRRIKDPSKKITLSECCELFDWINKAMDQFAAQLDDELKSVWSKVTSSHRVVSITFSETQSPSATNVVTTSDSIISPGFHKRS